ncbi:hypothetical protein BB560_004765, partial [Smittium megazygosporum]
RSSERTNMADDIFENAASVSSAKPKQAMVVVLFLPSHQNWFLTQQNYQPGFVSER